ncbi:MAG: triose-phosphate isomerase [Candidatus Paceibacterota bacterium]
MSKKIIIANWKMNPVSKKEAEKLFVSINKSISNVKNTEVIICPPVIYLNKLKAISYKLKAKLGAQNFFYEESGAYTGEISANMVYELGARYVILGHSERRIMGENSDDVNKKIKASLRESIIPIVCIGEKERDENHNYLSFIREQLEVGFKNISKDVLSKIIIAYEPVWAIGKNATREATPEEFLEMKIFIKKVLSMTFGVKCKIPRVIYGGSVNEKNVVDFIEKGEADGFLIGRASLDVKKFSKIVNMVENIY